jgi:hypothetical protein
MPDLQILRVLLEKYGAKKVTRPDLHTPCEVYELDPQKHDKWACNQEIDDAGFEFANWATADVYNMFAGEKRLVTPTSDIRGLAVTESGVVKQDDSDAADARVIDALLAGEKVQYGSLQEKERVKSKLKPGAVVIELDLEFILNEARQRNHVRAGDAIILANPHSPRIYGLLMEKAPDTR